MIWKERRIEQEIPLKLKDISFAVKCIFQPDKKKKHRKEKGK